MAEFREAFVETDGFRIRYMEAGSGPPLVHLHGAGGMRISPAHELLAGALMATGHPIEAQQEYARALARAPGRAPALRGLAQARRTP